MASSSAQNRSHRARYSRISVPLTGPAAVWEPCVTGDDGAAASLQVHCQQSHLANQPVLWSPLSPEAGGGDISKHVGRVKTLSSSAPGWRRTGRQTSACCCLVL